MSHDSQMDDGRRSVPRGPGKCPRDVDRSPSWWQEKSQASEQGPACA